MVGGQQVKLAEFGYSRFLVFVTQFGHNYSRIYLQLMVIYIIYALLHILHDLEPFATLRDL